jgi:hypothetical protein
VLADYSMPIHINAHAITRSTINLRAGHAAMKRDGATFRSLLTGREMEI